MRGQPAILNLLTCLTLAATGLVVLVVAVVMVLPGLVPGFMRAATEPVQVSIVTPVPTAAAGLVFPTLPPEWTATPSPQPSPTNPSTATPTASPEATNTPFVVTPPASRTPAASATSARVVQMARFANVRSGPSTAYPVVASLNAAQTAPVIGRDNSSLWFAISFAGAPHGIGWVSTLVATYGGNINDLPVIQPAAPPPPTAVPPTSTPATVGPPTATSLPNVGGANGIQTLKFTMPSTTGSISQHMQFFFQVINNTGSTINYGILAAHTDQGVTADSWHEPLQPGKILTWDDYIAFSTAGTYQVYLGICYASHDACKSGGAAWTRLSNSISVTIY